MGIFGGVPSGGKGSGSSRRDRRQAGGRKRSKTAARRETEQRAQVFILAGIVLAALLVVGIGAFGYYETNIKPMHATVLKVGSRTFQMGSVEKRIAYEIKKGAALTGSDPQVAVAQTLNTIESEEITRLNAAQQNISVSEDEIDKQIRTQLAIPDTADQSTYADAYRSDVKKSGLSVKDYREIIAAKLLEDKIRWVIAAGISPTADQVHLLDIQVSSQTDAQSVVDRLNAGEDFVAVADASLPGHEDEGQGSGYGLDAEGFS